MSQSNPLTTQLIPCLLPDNTTFSIPLKVYSLDKPYLIVQDPHTHYLFPIFPHINGPLLLTDKTVEQIVNARPSTLEGDFPLRRFTNYNTHITNWANKKKKVIQRNFTEQLQRNENWTYASILRYATRNLPALSLDYIKEHPISDTVTVQTSFTDLLALIISQQPSDIFYTKCPPDIKNRKGPVRPGRPPLTDKKEKSPYIGRPTKGIELPGKPHTYEPPPLTEGDNKALMEAFAKFKKGYNL